MVVDSATLVAVALIKIPSIPVGMNSPHEKGMYQSVMPRSCVEIVRLLKENDIVGRNAAAVVIDDVAHEVEIATQHVDDAVENEHLALENEKSRKNQLMRWEPMDFLLIQII